jgi:hypothetical protein
MTSDSSAKVVSCSGKVWNNAAMESAFSSLKTERGAKLPDPRRGEI